MRIVAVNNTVFHENSDGIFVYKETGKFFNELHGLGNEVIAFQTSIESDQNFLSNYDLTKTDIEVVAVKRSKFILFSYFRAFIKGWKVIRKSDFVYLFYPGMICTVLAFIAIIHKKNYGFYIRGEQGIDNFINRKLYKQATVSFTISPSFTRYIKTIGGRGYTIRPMMTYSASDIVVNRSYKAKDIYDFLFVGRIERDKGIYEIIEAAHLLIAAGYKTFRINFVGDGADLNLIRERVNEENLNEIIKFHGAIYDTDVLKSFYLKCDVFLLPTYHEGFPRVLYEALIFGIPIITTFVGTISTLFEDRKNCVRIDPQNIVDLKTAMKMFLDDYEGSATIASKGTETIKKYLEDKNQSHAEHLTTILNESE